MGGHFFGAGGNALQVLADVLGSLGHGARLGGSLLGVSGDLLTGGGKFLAGAGHMLRRLGNRLDDLVQTVLHLVESEAGLAKFILAGDPHILDGQVLIGDLLNHREHVGDGFSNGANDEDSYPKPDEHTDHRQDDDQTNGRHFQLLMLRLHRFLQRVDRAVKFIDRGLCIHADLVCTLGKEVICRFLGFATTSQFDRPALQVAKDFIASVHLSPCRLPFFALQQLAQFLHGFVGFADAFLAALEGLLGTRKHISACGAGLKLDATVYFGRKLFLSRLFIDFITEVGKFIDRGVASDSHNGHDHKQRAKTEHQFHFQTDLVHGTLRQNS